MSKKVAIFVAVAVIAIISGDWIYNKVRLWAEQSALNAEIEREYHALGKKAAEKILCLARPWFYKQPDPQVMNKAEDFGEFRARVERLSEYITLSEHYESPNTVIRQIIGDYARCVAREIKEYPITDSEIRETYKKALENKGLDYAAGLEKKLYKISNMEFGADKCRNHRKLEKFREEFCKERSELQEMLSQEIVAE